MADHTKRCSTCGVTQSVTECNVRRAAFDGLQSRCRTCNKAWYAQHRETHLANVRARNGGRRRANVGTLAPPPSPTGTRARRSRGHSDRVSALPLAQQNQELTGLAGWVADVIAALGPVGVGLLVALENLFPPIPSEVVLPLAGFLAGQGRMALPLVILAATVGSVVGALLLYWLGAAVGRDRLAHALERMPLTDDSDLERAEGWFDRHGGTAVLTGRMVPVVRSLISVPAGVEHMPLGKFAAYTTLGSAAYNTVLVLAGYWLGTQWTSVGQYSSLLSYAVIGAIVLAVGVVVFRRVRSGSSA